jgi:hypothetical protein
MIRVVVLRLATLLLLAPAVLAAQEAGAFTITRGTDTVAQERWSRDSSILSASLTRGADASARERVHYKATLLPDASAPLIELSVWRGDDAEGMPARQTTRIIFKDDSVAVDEATSTGGVRTFLLQTQRAAIAYLNLSIALMEQATRRAEATRGDSLSVPFFNLGGGQTVTGLVSRLGADSALVRIGSVEFRLKVDRVGRILGGTVPSQGLEITRGAGH